MFSYFSDCECGCGQHCGILTAEDADKGPDLAVENVAGPHHSKAVVGDLEQPRAEDGRDVHVERYTSKVAYGLMTVALTLAVTEEARL